MNIYILSAIGLTLRIWTASALVSSTSPSLTSRRQAVLIEELLSGYEPDVRPIANLNDTVTVTFDMALQQIIDIDEKSQQMTAGYWLRMSWHDVTLQWNPVDYDNIEQFSIIPTRIWRPDIALYTDVSIERREIESMFLAKVKYNGLVMWNAPAVFITSCILDVTDFPYDKQSCPQEFGSWAYSGEELDIVNATPSADLTVFIDAGEWELLRAPVHRKVAVYAAGTYPSLIYTIEVHRKTLFYNINIVLPAIILLMCGMLVFWLPPTSEEKVSLSVTLLLASSVFLLVIMETMPAQSAVVPHMVKFFLATMFILAINLIISVMIIRVKFYGSLRRPMPEIIHKVILRWLATLLCLRPIVKINLGPFEMEERRIVKVVKFVHDPDIDLEKIDTSKAVRSNKKRAQSKPTNGNSCMNNAFELENDTLAQHFNEVNSTGRNKQVKKENHQDQIRDRIDTSKAVRSNKKRAQSKPTNGNSHKNITFELENGTSVQRFNKANGAGRNRQVKKKNHQDQIRDRIDQQIKDDNASSDNSDGGVSISSDGSDHYEPPKRQSEQEKQKKLTLDEWNIQYKRSTAYRRTQWMLVAMVLDKFFLVLFALLIMGIVLFSFSYDLSHDLHDHEESLDLHHHEDSH